MIHQFDPMVSEISGPTKRCRECGEVEDHPNHVHVTLPVIHINGTSPEDLLNDNMEVSQALDAALDRIQRMEFNARDYYPRPGSWDKAVAERRKHIEALRQAQDYFMAVAVHCSDAVAERAARRKAC